MLGKKFSLGSVVEETGEAVLSLLTLMNCVSRGQTLPPSSVPLSPTPVMCIYM